MLCVDLSQWMLALAQHGWRVRADAARLPIADSAAAAIVVGDAPLFAAECVRVLAPTGVVLWVNALGLDAPFYLSTDVVIERCRPRPVVAHGCRRERGVLGKLGGATPASSGGQVPRTGLPVID